MFGLDGLENMTEKNDLTYDRSSHRRYSVRKVVLRNFTKFTGKHLCQSLFFNKVAGLRPATLLKRRLWPEACNFIEKKDWHSFFPMNFVKFLRTLFFLQSTPGRLFLFCFLFLDIKATRIQPVLKN